MTQQAERAAREQADYHAAHRLLYPGTSKRTPEDLATCGMASWEVWRQAYRTAKALHPVEGEEAKLEALRLAFVEAYRLGFLEGYECEPRYELDDQEGRYAALLQCEGESEAWSDYRAALSQPAPAVGDGEC